MRHLYCFIVFCLLTFSVLATAQDSGGYRPKMKSSATESAEQRRLVGEWCHIDFDGARLDSAGWQKLSPLTTIKALPEFQIFYVVSRYDIQQPDEDSDVLLVSYAVLGVVDVLNGYTPGKDVVKVEIRTTRQDGQFLVEELGSARPFVSRVATLRWFEKRLAVATSETERKILQRSIAALTETGQTPAR